MINVFQRKLNDRPTSDYSSEAGDDTKVEPVTV